MRSIPNDDQLRELWRDAGADFHRQRLPKVFTEYEQDCWAFAFLANPLRQFYVFCCCEELADAGKITRVGPDLYRANAP